MLWDFGFTMRFRSLNVIWAAANTRTLSHAFSIIISKLIVDLMPVKMASLLSPWLLHQRIHSLPNWLA
jgi:hypothetical protein